MILSTSFPFLQAYRRAATPPTTPMTAPMARTAELPVAIGAAAVAMGLVPVAVAEVERLPAGAVAEIVAVAVGPEVTGPEVALPPRRPWAEAMESSWL